MNQKRILSAAMASVLSLSILLPSVAPVTYASGGITSSFSDITDPSIARDVDVLRLMGVIDGDGNNNFFPNDTLTRGEFCKMIVSIMGKTDELPLYATRTIFNDVPASHWAAPFVNLAACTQVSEGVSLVAGAGDGTFLPNNEITFAQAVTILVRALGYSDDDTGALWPIGYLNMAKSIGLTDGMSIGTDSTLTRAQAADLFVRLLDTNTKDGTPYYNTLGATAIDNAMLLATNITTENGKSGAIATSEGTYVSAANLAAPVALEGARGVLVLNSKQQIVTFVPDDSSSVAGTMTAGAQATNLTLNNKKYSVNSSVPVFSYGTTTTESTYADTWFDLASGTKVTLFLDSGIVTAIYVGKTERTTDAVVVSASPSRTDFYGLTNGNTSFTIERNGVPIGIEQLNEYDVATYDVAANTLVVSDLRISVVYERATPNSATPTSIYALGHDFPVLEDAIAQSDDVKVGSVVTLLLTADGNVAAMKKPSLSYSPTAYGIASGNTVELTLPAGGTVTLTSSDTLADKLQDRLVSVGSAYAGKMSTYLLNSNGGGTLDLNAMKLGDRKIAPNCAVYEAVEGGAIIPMSFNAVDADTLPSSDIAYYRADSSNNVTVIVLDNVTGNGYTYGMLEEHKKDDGSGVKNDNRMVSVHNSGKGSMPAVSELVSSAPFETGDFGGVAIGGLLAGTTGERRASSVIVLDNVGTVSRSDFLTIDDIIYVKVAGRTYQLASEVECYNADTTQWTSLNNLRAQTDSLTIHVDPIAQMVRVISGTEK